MRKYITEQTVNGILYHGEPIEAINHEDACSRCPIGWTVSEWWIVAEIDENTDKCVDYDLCSLN